MRKYSLFAFLAAFSLTVAAQQQQKEQPKKEQPQAQQKEDKQQADPAEERTRVEGAAGGTAPVPAEKRKGVGAGAGPHLHDDRPSPAKLPKDEPVQPPK